MEIFPRHKLITCNTFFIYRLSGPLKLQRVMINYFLVWNRIRSVPKNLLEVRAFPNYIPLPLVLEHLKLCFLFLRIPC